MTNVQDILVNIPLEYSYRDCINHLHSLWRSGIITSEEFRDCCISIMDAQIEFEREMARGEIK